MHGGARGGWALRLIALERAFRGILLLVLGIYLLTKVHADWGVTVRHIAQRLGLDPQQRLVARAIDAAHGLSPHRQVLLGAVAIGYGVLELVEGVGLWYRQRWAEWLTVIATTLLIPFEIYEIARHPSFLKAGGIAVNIVIVLYLVRVLRRNLRADAAGRAGAGGSAGGAPDSPG